MGVGVGFKRSGGRGPVFLHSSYRTSSTWFLSKIRSSDSVYAYYEIFHELLSSVRRDEIENIKVDSWNSKHPSFAPYFLEFMPLIRDEGGVDGYDASMAYEKFIPEDGVGGIVSDAELRYVNSLIENADSHNRIPVLSCTRSLARAKCLDRVFGGNSIFLYRNLFHQWASYSGQYVNGNDYFIKRTDDIIRSSTHDPFIKNLNEFLASREVSAYCEKMFLAFMIFHIYLYAKSYDKSYLCVDVNKLAELKEYRIGIEADISKMIGCSIDLSDVKLDFELSVVSIRDKKWFIDSLNQFIKLIESENLSEDKILFAKGVKDSAVSEFDKYEFFLKGSRYLFAKNESKKNEEIGKLKSDLSEVQENLNLIKNETSDLYSKISELSLEKEALIESVKTMENLKDQSYNQCALLKEREIEQSQKFLDEINSHVHEKSNMLLRLQSAAAIESDFRKEISILKNELDANRNISKKYQDLMRQIQSILNSNSWKVTKPLRFFSEFARSIVR